MDAATERRDPQLSRVPFEGPIELFLDGYDEGFFAEGVDLGLGGIALRSSVLPDVGSRLVCRFDVEGDPVEVPGEVVWAALEGPRIGSFGLRFEGISLENEAAVAQLVDDWHRDLAVHDAYDSFDDEPESFDDADSLDEGAPLASDALQPGALVEVRLDGVGPAIEAELIHAGDDALVVEQALPFLRLDTIVTAEGRRGELKDVALRLDGGVPRLVFTLWLDEERAAPVNVAPATVIDEPSISPPDLLAEVSSLAGAPRSERETIQGAPEETALVSAEGDLAREEEQGRAALTPEEDELALDARSEIGSLLDSLDDGPDDGAVEDEPTTRAREREASRVFELERDDVPTPVPHDGRGSVAVGLDGRIDPAELGKSTLRLRGAELLARLASVRVWVALVARQIMPRAARLGQQLSGLMRRLAPRAVELGKTFGARVGGLAGTIRARGVRVPGAKQKAKKRQTARPAPARASRPAARRQEARGEARVEPEAEGRGARKKRARQQAAAIGVGAFALVAGAAFAFGGDDQVEGDAAAVATPPSEPLATDAVAPSSAPAPAVVGLLPAEPEPSASAEVAAAEPAVSAAAERRAGRIPAPSFPTLQDATRPPSPGEVPANSPYAEQPVEQDNAVRRFGAENISARYEFGLRLSGDNQGLRGEETTDGFVVHLPGVSSLDPAGRIASTHPRIAAASIENDDEGAHLRVTFREGRRPDFRVDLTGRRVRLRFSR